MLRGHVPATSFAREVHVRSGIARIQVADPINPLLAFGTAKDAAGSVDPSNQLPEGLATRVAA